MAEKNKVVGYDEREERQVRNEWQTFSKTLAYKRMMEYAESHGNTLLRYAEERAMPDLTGKGMRAIDNEMSNSLLQNKRGIGIITSYIRLYSEN